MMQLIGKVALITGAAEGIGRATAIRFSDEGAVVCIVDVNEELGRRTLEQITQKGGKAIFVQADVSQSKDVQASVDKTLKEYGNIDILVNNAAIFIQGSVTTLEEEQWDRTLAVNLKSMYLYGKRVIPIMVRQGGGVILNMGSVLSLVGRTDYAAYCASKGGILALTRAMALDYANKGIRVNCICPGVVNTSQLEVCLKQHSLGQQKAYLEIIDRYPIGRIAEPSEVAGLLAYLASEEASFITGVAYPFDGGFTSQ
jgi:NAD(P)-dependent dehydrogenase (short-subunit alcohol dehydrogenase family)